ncbi:hypothetical protein [Microterricola viridarii]|uniref:Uncharacterized protein n=1 Tax=Microterricola viridarii TaxID=412690 RepID=A0A109QWL0_9MICO|nr:hypothetical protein [Microterricola viridarii]AMB58232.1 hypothetical protein AWU67_04515 [Microterricola viridarii]
MDSAITIIVALIAVSGGWAAARFGRVSRLEKRITQLEARERRMWVYCRTLIDHGYRHGDGTPMPPPPEDLYGEDTTP